VRALWFSVLAPPSAAVVAVSVDFSIAHIVCHGASMVWLHLFTVLMLAVSVAGGLLGRLNLKRSREGWPRDEYGVIPRSQFLSTLAVGGSVLFTLIILVLWIPILVLNPCYLT
jgi:hypothetical protein